MKVQRIYESSLEINYNSPGQEFSLYWDSFLQSEIGQIYQAVPWADLIKHFNLRENKKGPARFFSPQGMIALMYLKSYVGCSDKKLIEHLNGNINFQLFCDIFLQGKRLTNFKIVSQVRTYLSTRLNIYEAQKILAKHWKPFIDHPNIMLTDATCYETAMRYPTNVKLLWESVDWCYGQLKRTCEYLKIRTPRTKYLKQKERYGNYSSKRRKSKKERRVLSRCLLHLLRDFTVSKKILPYNRIIFFIKSLFSVFISKKYIPFSKSPVKSLIFSLSKKTDSTILPVKSIRLRVVFELLSIFIII